MTSEVAAAREAGEAMRSRLSGTLDAPRLKAGVPLAPLTTFLVGGPADLLYDATSGDDLAIAVTAARAADVPWTILGLGANVLVGDRGIRGLVIRNASGSLAVEGTRMLADSGVAVRALIRESFARGLGGLEHYVGIPSTVGGALWQNLHFLSPAPARERTMFIAEVVRTVDLLLQDGSRVTVSGEQMQFGYDTSRLHASQEVALRAEFALVPAERDVIERTAQENLAWRGARHPWLEFHPSAGSVFRKAEGVGAGRLIDQCGLKGYRVGGAQVSFLHANIIVNRGDATARDIQSLIGEIQERVHTRFGVRLEPEIGFKGEF